MLILAHSVLVRGALVRRILTSTPRRYLSQVEAVSTARFYAGRDRANLGIA